MSEKKFQIDFDLITLFGWLAKETTDEDPYFISNVAQQVKDYQDNLVFVAFNLLSQEDRSLLLQFYRGNCSLLPDTKRYFNRAGFLWGQQFPQAVAKLLLETSNYYVNLEMPG